MPYFPFGHRPSSVLQVLVSGVLVVAPCSWAQSPVTANRDTAAVAMPPASAASTPSRGKVASSTGVPAKVVSSKPLWNELSPPQQLALKPLAASWDLNMSEAQKRKWLELSKSYPSLPADGQTKLHSRMNEWVSLSAQERAEARLNFAKTKELSGELTPEEKKAKWQTYQALSADEKAKLAARAAPKPTGAATAIKPVAPQKLASVPPHNVSKVENRQVTPKMVPVPVDINAKSGVSAPTPTPPAN